MRKFTITASDGDELTGYLPEGWHEVPLTPYVALAQAALALPPGLDTSAHAYASPAGCEALAALLGLSSAAPLHADYSLLLPLYEAAPWLLDGPLPAGTEPAPTLTHLGRHYTHIGPLDTVSGANWEGLATMLQSAEGSPLLVANQLLAILYAPTGQAQSPENVRDTALAFQTLPMHLAWPALQAFLVRSLPLALPIQRYLAAQPLVAQAVSALEHALAATSPASAPRGFYSNTGRWLAKRWLKLVRRKLRPFLPPSATTAAAPPSPSSPVPTRNPFRLPWVR